MSLAGTSNLPVAPKNTPWHASAAKQRVLEACDGTVACIARAFLWRSEGDPREAGSWSLPFCDVIDGRLHIVPKGIAAAAGVRGIGSFAVTASDRAQIQSRITAIYDRVRREVPEWPASPFALVKASLAPATVSGWLSLLSTTNTTRLSDTGSARTAGGRFLSTREDAQASSVGLVQPSAVANVQPHGGRPLTAGSTQLESNSFTGRTGVTTEGPETERSVGSTASGLRNGTPSSRARTASAPSVSESSETGIVFERVLTTTTAPAESGAYFAALATSLLEYLGTIRRGSCERQFTASLRADASGLTLEGVICIEGVDTGDGRHINEGALTWGDGPWPLVFDRAEMDHSGATVGTINEIERREGGVIWARGSLSASEDPETQELVTRAAELFEEGAVGVSVSLDDVQEDCDEEVCAVTSGRIRSVAVVDEAAFVEAKMGLVASTMAVRREWFADPRFGNGSASSMDDGGDERLVWQEPERPEEEGQFGCPLTITADGHIFGHAALWGRCHVGYAGTCTRPPKEPAAYRGFLTGERIPGVPTGPLVMKTRHAPDHLGADAAGYHYDHTGYAGGDVTIGPDAYGIWVSGGVRLDATEADIEIMRASALSGDWRPMGGKHRLVGLLAVNAPGFRVARAMAASGALITSGPGCDECDSVPSYDDRLAAIERVLAAGLVAGVNTTIGNGHVYGTGNTSA